MSQLLNPDFTVIDIDINITEYVTHSMWSKYI